MKLKPTLLFLSFFFLIAACEKADDPENLIDNQLIGHWINPQHNEDYSIITFVRGNDFNQTEYGVAFKKNQVFIERKNASGCGTPPITYGNFNGNWSTTDSMLSISVENWHGTADYQWRVSSIDHLNLTIEIINQEYHWPE